MRPGEFQRVLPKLLDLRVDPPVSRATPELIAALKVERERLHLFYAAGLYAQSGQSSLWSRDIRRVLREDGRNPYYTWFTAGARP